MALHAAEEESIEALKQWWRDNSRLLISVVVTAAVGWGGWTLWQGSRTATINGASDAYEEILTLVMVEPGEQVSAENRTRVIALADTLRSDYPATIYARYGALFAAQQKVNAGDLAGAELDLQWVVDNTQGGLFAADDPVLVLTATLRLGRVILARGDHDRALELVNQVDPGPLESDFAELRGDIYLAQGRNVDAHDAYLAAQQAGSTSQFLQMKLDELASES